MSHTKESMKTITIAILSSIAVSIIMRTAHITNITYGMCNGVLINTWWKLLIKIHVMNESQSEEFDSSWQIGSNSLTVIKKDFGKKEIN